MVSCSCQIHRWWGRMIERRQAQPSQAPSPGTQSFSERETVNMLRWTGDRELDYFEAYMISTSEINVASLEFICMLRRCANAPSPPPPLHVLIDTHTQQQFTASCPHASLCSLHAALAETRYHFSKRKSETCPKATARESV